MTKKQINENEVIQYVLENSTIRELETLLKDVTKAIRVKHSNIARNEYDIHHDELLSQSIVEHAIDSVDIFELVMKQISKHFVLHNYDYDQIAFESYDLTNNRDEEIQSARKNIATLKRKADKRIAKRQRNAFFRVDQK